MRRAALGAYGQRTATSRVRTTTYGATTT